MTWLDKLDMGKYALYVWGSFGMAAFCLILEPVLLYFATRKIKKDFSSEETEPR